MLHICPKPCETSEGEARAGVRAWTHLRHAGLLGEHDIAACSVRGWRESETRPAGWSWRDEACARDDRADEGARRTVIVSDAPRGPSVTATASASLSIPSWILIRDFMSKVRSLASARTLRAARATAARVVRVVTLEPVKACGSDWKVGQRNQPPHFLPKRRVRCRWTRAGGYGTAHEGQEARKSTVHAPATRTPGIHSRRRSDHAPGAFSERADGARSVSSAGGKASKNDMGPRRTSRLTVRAARGEACMTPCIVVRLVAFAVGEQSHEPVARRVTRGPYVRRTRSESRRFIQSFAFRGRSSSGRVATHRRNEKRESDSCRRPQPLGHGRQRKSTRG